VPRLFTAQTNFSSGELDPAMRLRTDTGAYGNGAKELTNVQLLNTGGGRRRDGTYHKATLPALSRLKNFEFDGDETYVFCFQNALLQIYRPSDGALLANLAHANFTTARLFEMTFAQLGDVLLIFHKEFKPLKVTRTGLTSFTLADFSFTTSIDGSQYQQPYYKFMDDSVTMAASNESGVVTLTCSHAYFTPGHVGRRIRIHKTQIVITGYTSATVATGQVYGVIKPTLNNDPLKSIKGSGQVDITIPQHGLNANQALTLSGANDIAGITAAQINTTFAVQSGTFSAGEWRIRNPNVILVYTAGTATSGIDGGGASVQYVVDNQQVRDWDEEVFSTANGWPACGAFHQQRLYLGGPPEIPSGLFGSVVGSFFNFDLGTAEPTDAIFIQVGQENGVTVRHLVSGKHLQIFTEVGEFYTPQADGQPLTPLTITALKQTPYGIGSVAPVSLDGATIFLQKSKTAVREFIYSEAERSYNSNPLSLAAAHMLVSPVDLAVLYGTDTRPEQYALLVNSDGELAVFHSARVERLAGWAHWQTATGHKFRSITVVDGVIWACVERDATFYLERFATSEELTLDGASEFSNASAQSVWTVGARYANKTVWVLSRNDDLTLEWSIGTYTVSGAGVLTLNTSHKKIVIGFWYPFRIESLTPSLQVEEGTLLGEIKRIAQVQVGLHMSQSVDVQGQALILRQTTDDFSIAPAKFSGYQTFSILGYSREPTIEVSQTDPLPLTVLGLVMKVSV
jgi:hypothetical protein